MINNSLFKLLQASLFTEENVLIQDWNTLFAEMEVQAIATLPGEWMKNHPVAPEWSKYCSLQQGQWVRVMHGQNQLLFLLESNNIPCVIIKGAAAAMYYPHPTLRSMGDVDFLVKRSDFLRTAELLESNGYTLSHDKDENSHHYGYTKDRISFELHHRVGSVSDDDEKLLCLFEEGIDHRVWHDIDGCRFTTLPPLQNGLVLIFHINQHLREGLGLRQIIDWMMYVNQLSAAQWEELRGMLQRVDMEKLALTTTRMCQMYFGLKLCFPGCEEVAPMLCDDLMAFILSKGNFGRKAGLDGKIEAFSLSATEKGGFF